MKSPVSDLKKISSSVNEIHGEVHVWPHVIQALLWTCQTTFNKSLYMYINIVCNTLHFPGGDRLRSGRMPTEESGVTRMYHYQCHTLCPMPCHPWKENGVASLDREGTGHRLPIEGVDGLRNGVIVKVWGWAHLSALEGHLQVYQDGLHLECCLPTGRSQRHCCCLEM